MPEELQKIGKVETRVLEQEMQESYLDYAMSVIVSRALPDVRDGLKPVHRRILYAMHEIGLRAKAKFRKSATVVGEVLGKYHPHGDIAVYDTLVRMAQPFSMRYPLIDGQGNFGSLDGDAPAAMRYSEVRMSEISEELLIDIEKETVDFMANYDATRQEPKILPAKLPNLLLNGQMGIAVGMATNIPPHNLGEICAAIIHLIDNQEVSVDELMQFIQGPDFPTGGEIFNKEEIKSAYATGKGKIMMRGRAEIEETKKENFRIIITELPYQTNKADLITHIAELVRDKKIEGINDLRDESDREANVRIVVELKNNAYPKKVLNRLFDLTALQSSFHFNMLALLNGIEPRILSLKNILEEYIRHREKIIVRRTQFDLKKAEEREHILEGLKKALDQIDKVISLIKKSSRRETALLGLKEKFALSELQANAILEMRLANLAALERKKINQELEQIKKAIIELKSILASKEKIKNIIKDEVKTVGDKYADRRRTKVFQKPLGDFSAEDLIPNEQVIVTLSKSNYIKRVVTAVYRPQERGGKGVLGQTLKEEDIVAQTLACETHDDIMFFTDRGRVFTTKVYELPIGSRLAKGQAVVNVLQISPEEKVTAICSLPASSKTDNNYFFIATKRGIVKKTIVAAFRRIRKTGIAAIKLRPGDELRWAKISNGRNNIIIVTRLGQSIYFEEEQVRPMGRAAAGVKGIKLQKDDEVIAVDVVEKEEPDYLLAVLENGFGKKTSLAKHFHTQNRGGSGVKAAKVTSKTGSICEALIVKKDEGDVILVSQNGQVIRLHLSRIKSLGRDTQGVTLMRLKKGDKVATVTYLTQFANKTINPQSQITKPKSLTADAHSNEFNYWGKWEKEND